MAAKAAGKLRELGVELRCGKRVESIDSDGVVASGERILAKNVIWAAGVTASPAGRWLDVETDRAGRVKVGPNLTLARHPEIYVIGHLELGWLRKSKRPVLFVSLETSRTLPGAEIGKGPVVRLGDRYTVFDPGALRIFSDLAVQVLPNQHQRRVMDGGTCEATAATVFGYPCVGISVPLGNYHNQSFEGGPDSQGSLGPAPEFVHLQDVRGMLSLCQALLTPKLPWMQPWKAKLQEFKKSLVKSQPLLRSGP